MRFFLLPHSLPLFPPSSLSNFLLSPYSSWRCLDITAKARATDSLRGRETLFMRPFFPFPPRLPNHMSAGALAGGQRGSGLLVGVVGRFLRNPFFWVTEPRWPQEVVERFSSLGARGRLTTGTSSLGLRVHFNSSSSSRPPVCYV